MAINTGGHSVQVMPQFTPADPKLMSVDPLNYTNGALSVLQVQDATTKQKMLQDLMEENRQLKDSRVAGARAGYELTGLQRDKLRDTLASTVSAANALNGIDINTADAKTQDILGSLNFNAKTRPTDLSLHIAQGRDAIKGLQLKDALRNTTDETAFVAAANANQAAQSQAATLHNTSLNQDNLDTLSFTQTAAEQAKAELDIAQAHVSNNPDSLLAKQKLNEATIKNLEAQSRLHNAQSEAVPNRADAVHQQLIKTHDSYADGYKVAVAAEKAQGAVNVADPLHRGMKIPVSELDSMIEFDKAGHAYAKETGRWIDKTAPVNASSLQAVAEYHQLKQASTQAKQAMIQARDQLGQYASAVANAKAKMPIPVSNSGVQEPEPDGSQQTSAQATPSVNDGGEVVYRPSKSGGVEKVAAPQSNAQHPAPNSKSTLGDYAPEIGLAGAYGAAKLAGKVPAISQSIQGLMGPNPLTSLYKGASRASSYRGLGASGPVAAISRIAMPVAAALAANRSLGSIMGGKDLPDMKATDAIGQAIAEKMYSNEQKDALVQGLVERAHAIVNSGLTDEDKKTQLAEIRTKLQALQ